MYVWYLPAMHTVASSPENILDAVIFISVTKNIRKYGEPVNIFTRV